MGCRVVGYVDRWWCSRRTNKDVVCLEHNDFGKSSVYPTVQSLEHRDNQVATCFATYTARTLVHLVDSAVQGRFSFSKVDSAAQVQLNE
jgi:hypothetical protein